MGYCDGLISTDVSVNCANPVIPGIESRGVIINREDVDFDNIEYDATRSNVIKELPLKTGKKGYAIVIPGTQPFNGTTTTLEVATIRNTFTNNLGAIILANDPDVCRKVIDSLASGKFVVVFENKYKNLRASSTPGDSTFQIMGLSQGLVAATLENDKYSEDTQGGWNVVLTETGVPESALFFFDTNIANTRTNFNALLVEASSS
jgi:hypothetical protein